MDILLNGVWEFAPAPDGSPPAGGWQPIRVPHRSREFEDNPPESGWYRTRLRVPADWKPEEGRIVLDLGRVRHYGRAWVDGQVVGEHYHMRRSWRLDLEGRVQAGGEHELLVYTHNCTGAYAHPHVKELSEAAANALDTRFWFTSAATVGMEGDVRLALEPRVRIEDPYVITSVRENSFRVEALVRNQSAATFAGRVDWQVKRQGRIELELPSCEVEVAPGQVQKVEFEVPWADPVLWGRPPYGEPVLYFLQARLGNGEKKIHQEIVRFGFREIWAQGEDLLLNGEKLVPWGDHTVPYVYERQWLTRKLVDLAAANISILEHHRYDPPSVFYEVADELGCFVVGANFCVGTGQVPRENLDEDEQQVVMESHLEVADEWIRRARNHPSILFWDITDAREPSFCVPLLRKVKELDQSRIAEVTFDPGVANAELIDLIDCYRLFSSLEQIEGSINKIRSEPQYPVKPVRVGEAGIFDGADWPSEEEPPLQQGWWEFLLSLRERNVHGLQTFHLADMDYRGLTRQVPNNLVAPVHPQVSWPSQSGPDARIDPFGEGTQQAWGKESLYLNWCDPAEPVSRPTATNRWSQDLFRRLAGRDVGALAQERVPEVIVAVVQGGKAVAGAQVFVEALAGQSLTPFGVQADERGSSWFVLPESGWYRFSCENTSVEVEANCAPIEAPAGYDHIQQVQLELPGT
jgi:hypothetical protein